MKNIPCREDLCRIRILPDKKTYIYYVNGSKLEKGKVRCFFFLAIRGGIVEESKFGWPMGYTIFTIRPVWFWGLGNSYFLLRILPEGSLRSAAWPLVFSLLQFAFTIFTAIFTVRLGVFLVGFLSYRSDFVLCVYSLIWDSSILLGFCLRLNVYKWNWNTNYKIISIIKSFNT